MKALVTGAGGFIGGHLVRFLAAKGTAIETLGVREGAPVPGARHHRVDPADASGVAAALRAARPDLVFHLAGLAAAPSVAEVYRVNTLFAANILDGLAKEGLADRPVLLVGTGAEYGVLSGAELPVLEDGPARPYGHYGASKLAQTHLGKIVAARTPVVVARPFNVIGPGMPTHVALQSFAAQVAAIAAGERPPVIETGELSTARDFVDVQDVVRSFAELVQKPAARGQVVNVCRGIPVVLSDLLDALIRIAGVKVERKVDPSRLKPIDVPVQYGSTARHEALLGWKPATDLDATLRRVYEHARESHR